MSEQLRSALEELMRVFDKHIQWNGVEHDDEECPEDDTCTCATVAEINAAFTAAEEALRQSRSRGESR